MRRYECVIIVDFDISENKLNVIFDKVSSEIELFEGFLIKIDDWGDKKLAYEIKRKSRGRYICFDFCSVPGLVSKIENYFKINDDVLKYMTVILERNVNLELIKKEITDDSEVELIADNEKSSGEDEHSLGDKAEQEIEEKKINEEKTMS